MWCPSVSLSVWANAWLAGRSAPDDVLDVLSVWAPSQSVDAYDAVAAGHTGLSWPGPHDDGPASLLQTLRSAAGVIRPVLPVPGDVRGLPPGTEFSRHALHAGEAVILCAAAIGLVPERDADETGLTWTVYALPEVPAAEQHDLGGAEYALRSAVRAAADTLMRLGSLCDGPDDPRDLVEDLVQDSREHRIPDHAPVRAVRVLETATLIDAIITVGAEATCAGALCASQADRARATLQPLSAVVRDARAAAVDSILHSAWNN